jgi:hypothetical protein
VGPRARLDGSGKSRPSGIRSPYRPAKSNSEEDDDDGDDNSDNSDDDDDDNNNNNNNNNNNKIKAAVLQINTST